MKKSTIRERLMASTFICGAAALTLAAAPAWAQTPTPTTAPGAQQPTPGTPSDQAVVEPNADDSNETQTRPPWNRSSPLVTLLACDQRGTSASSGHR